jgi:hypothetical protein
VPQVPGSTPLQALRCDARPAGPSRRSAPSRRTSRRSLPPRAVLGAPRGPSGLASRRLPDAWLRLPLRLPPSASAPPSARPAVALRPFAPKRSKTPAPVLPNGSPRQGHRSRTEVRLRLPLPYTVRVRFRWTPAGLRRCSVGVRAVPGCPGPASATSPPRPFRFRPVPGGAPAALPAVCRGFPLPRPGPTRDGPSRAHLRSRPDGLSTAVRSRLPASPPPPGFPSPEGELPPAHDCCLDMAPKNGACTTQPRRAPIFHPNNFGWALATPFSVRKAYPEPLRARGWRLRGKGGEAIDEPAPSPQSID